MLTFAGCALSLKILNMFISPPVIIVLKRWDICRLMTFVWVLLHGIVLSFSVIFIPLKRGGMGYCAHVISVGILKMIILEFYWRHLLFFEERGKI